MILWLDLETYNEHADLKKVGAYRYAETAEILLFAYGIDDEPTKVWDVTAETGSHPPADLMRAMEQATEVYAHNAGFDRTILNAIAPRLTPPLERWRCTMAMALSHALPAGLSELCSVLDVPEDLAKLKEGRRLLHLFTKPQPANRKVRRATRHTHPAEWERFKAYAINDIEAMRECARRMPRWNWDDSAIAEWHMDQRINDRGFFADRELTRAGKRATDNEKAHIAERFRELTMGFVDRPTQRAQFLEYLNDRFGLALDNTRADTFEHLIKAGGLDPECVELMRLSMAGNKNSTAKYAALEPAVSADGRFRGGSQFAGASRTRRQAGRIFQYQNLPSRGLPPQEEIELYIEALKQNTHDLFCRDLMRLGSAALRGVVIAPPGKKLVVADLSNIEGRKLAWYANEKWKLQAFRDYDAGIGPDLYNITAVSIVGGDPWNVPKHIRNVFGKVPDLASGYQGGVAGYQTFAHAYGVRMADHWETIQSQIDPQHIASARRNFTKWGRDQAEEMEISEIEWLASETCKIAWRSRHPATVKFWYALGDAAKNAISEPGRVFYAGLYLKLRCVTYKGFKWLVIRMPSGRHLTYFNPRLTRDGSITYEGEGTDDDGGARVWRTLYTHGGKLTGNVCQTSARDQLFPGMQDAEAHGYDVILSVHDEAVAEVPDTPEYTHEALAGFLAANRSWNTGLPLSAAGFAAYRYRKD